MLQKIIECVPNFSEGNDENIIKQINNPTARRIKYKDERKITIGMSKKDIMNCRGKVKNASIAARPTCSTRLTGSQEVARHFSKTASAVRPRDKFWLMRQTV